MGQPQRAGVDLFYAPRLRGHHPLWLAHLLGDVHVAHPAREGLQAVGLLLAHKMRECLQQILSLRVSLSPSLIFFLSSFQLFLFLFSFLPVFFLVSLWCLTIFVSRNFLLVLSFFLTSILFRWKVLSWNHDLRLAFHTHRPVLLPNRGLHCNNGPAVKDLLDLNSGNHSLPHMHWCDVLKSL